VLALLGCGGGSATAPAQVPAAPGSSAPTQPPTPSSLLIGGQSNLRQNSDGSTQGFAHLTLFDLDGSVRATAHEFEVRDADFDWRFVRTGTFSPTSSQLNGEQAVRAWLFEPQGVRWLDISGARGDRRVVSTLRFTQAADLRCELVHSGLTNYANPDSALAIVATAGPDGRCGGFDENLYLLRASMGAADAPIRLPALKYPNIARTTNGWPIAVVKSPQNPEEIAGWIVWQADQTLRAWTPDFSRPVAEFAGLRSELDSFVNRFEVVHSLGANSGTYVLASTSYRGGLWHFDPVSSRATQLPAAVFSSDIYIAPDLGGLIFLSATGGWVRVADASPSNPTALPISGVPNWIAGRDSGIFYVSEDDASFRQRLHRVNRQTGTSTELFVLDRGGSASESITNVFELGDQLAIEVGNRLDRSRALHFVDSQGQLIDSLRRIEAMLGSDGVTIDLKRALRFTQLVVAVRPESNSAAGPELIAIDARTAERVRLGTLPISVAASHLVSIESGQQGRQILRVRKIGSEGTQPRLADDLFWFEPARQNSLRRLTNNINF
jgi:hypothetical protein